MQPVRVAVIGRTGKGDYGHGIDTVWAEVPETQVVAVADENEAGRAKAAERLKAPAAYADYREMLDKEQPQIVAIGPRWIDAHREMIFECAERGCHIYMEKPFCRTLAEADDIIALLERKHVKLALAHQTRYSPLIPVVHQLIQSGQLGAVLEIRARGKEDARGGAEDLWVLGSHVLDLMRNFGGDPVECYSLLQVDSQLATASQITPGSEGLGPLLGQQVNAMFRLPQGVTGYFGSHRRQGGNPARFGIQIYGSKGIVEILTGYLPAVRFLPDPAWSPGRSNAAWVTVSSNGIGKPESLKDSGLHGGNVAAVRDLLACITSDRQPLCSAYDGRWTVEMIHAIFESHRLRGPVKLPLENRTQHPLERLAMQ